MSRKLDRVLGRAAIAIDATTRVDIGQLYLSALRRANGVDDSNLNSVGTARDPEIQ
jgi:hypothetical protein